ncbi:Transmembrane protein 60 [Blomia tropicalis]|nr:Transmembrane protein 60 [Blomia tropicalis]
MMKLSHRSLLTGLNWFLIFSPLYMMDLLTFLLIHTKRQTDILYDSNFNKIAYYCLSAKIVFQLLLCIKFEIFNLLPIYVIMVPMWCLLGMWIYNLFQTLVSE